MEKPLYEKIPHTGRSAALLSRRYGFRSVRRFAEALPEGARVVDVGAGNSNLGAAVALRRPDVQWLNLDLHHGPDYPSAEAKAAAPPNVGYVAGNILHRCVKSGSAELVLSNALLPFIVMTDVQLAYRALHVMREMLTDDGSLLLGKGVTNTVLWAQKDGAVRVDAATFDVDPIGTSLAIIREVGSTVVAAEALRDIEDFEGEA